MGELSGVLQLTDLNDFISPGQECTKPIQVEKSIASGGISRNPRVVTNGEFMPGVTLADLPKPQKVQITLNDCLACSGCITSAETVLIAEQSHEKLLQILTENAGKPIGSRKIVIVSVAPQVRASLAARFRLSLQDAGEHLSGMLAILGVDYVFDVQLGRNLSLYESAREFIRRYKTTDVVDGLSQPQNRRETLLPMIASACPGWICYAEKSHGNFILPYIDTTKSPQQIMGSLVKHVYADEIISSLSRACDGDVDASSIFHVTLMPCYDKKLEASRTDFYNDVLRTRDVDMVITSIEIEDLLVNKLQKQLQDFPRRPYDRLLQLSASLRDLENVIDESASHFGGGSGGYCENVFALAAHSLFGATDIMPGRLQYTAQRNQDFQDLTLTVDGEEKLRFAICYGFRNIQNIVQKLKRNRCSYHYVEIMACPSACLNGGGQIRPVDFETGQTVLHDDVVRKKWLQRVQDLYEEAPKTIICDVNNDSNWLATFYNEILACCDKNVHNDNCDEEAAKDDSSKTLHTQYHAIQRTANGLSIKW